MQCSGEEATRLATPDPPGHREKLCHEECIGKAHGPDMTNAEPQRGRGAVLAGIRRTQEQNGDRVEYDDQLPRAPRAQAGTEITALLEDGGGQALGGHLKSGHSWTGQNRPFRKPGSARDGSEVYLAAWC